MARSKRPAPAALADLPDDALLEAVQRQTFGFFWEGAHPVSGMARDRTTTTADPDNDLVALGATGFGAMALIVAADRGWVKREAAVERLVRILACLDRATCYHGFFPHFMNGDTGATIRFSRKDDGGDLVETAFLFQGLLCARQYFDRDTPAERQARDVITRLWRETEWNWHTRDGRKVLTWHWSPTNGFALDHEIRGWNECLIAYVLAASSPLYGVPADVYHRGYTNGRDFTNGRTYHGTTLPLGPDHGGPLFFSHYSFCGLDPRGLKDRYADYWQQNVAHTRVNYDYCVANPQGHEGYGPDCWGLTASDDPDGYVAHAPDNDNGTISPTAALSSLCYAPAESMRAMRHFLRRYGDRVWGRFGFVDAFCESRDWFADTYIGIDQGPIVVMIENHRTGLLWKLFMAIPEIKAGLVKLGFTSPHLEGTPAPIT